MFTSAVPQSSQMPEFDSEIFAPDLEVSVEDMESIAEFLAQDRVGTVSSTFALQTGNGVNFVFAFGIEDGQDVIVRLSPQGGKLKEYQNEKDLSDLAREHGIPTPHVLEVGTADVGSLGTYDYTIQELIDGVSGDCFKGSSLIVWKEIGRIARRINHIVPASDPANIDAYVEVALRALHHEAGLIDYLGLTESEVRNLGKRFLDVKTWGIPSRLTHCDLAPKNVVVDRKTGELQAVIDWGCAGSMPAPHIELAASLNYGRRAEQESFLAGYDLTSAEQKLFMPRVQSFRMLLHLVGAKMAFHRQDATGFRVRAKALKALLAAWNA